MDESKTNKGFQVRGDRNNPYHISVGIVVVEGDKVVLVKKESGKYTLPSETIYFNESLEEAVKRGAIEELGMVVEGKRFLGPIISFFEREDGTQVEKATLYFQVDKVEDGIRQPEKNEETDQIEAVDLEEAVSILKKEERPEAEILERIKIRK